MTLLKTDWDLAAGHAYRLPNGEIAINVSTIAKLMDDGRSEALANAAAWMARNGRDHKIEWPAKMDTGTRIHGVCERWLLGKDEDCFVRAEDEGYVDALEAFWCKHQPQMIECEAVVLSERGYGGRFDMIVRLQDGRTALIDVKTGKKYPVDHCLQLAAYRKADGIGVYENGRLTGLRPIPDVDFCACLYLAPDGTFRLVPYDDADDEAFEVFLLLLRAYRWSRGVKSKKRRSV